MKWNFDEFSCKKVEKMAWTNTTYLTSVRIGNILLHLKFSKTKNTENHILCEQSVWIDKVVKKLNTMETYFLGASQRESASFNTEYIAGTQLKLCKSLPDEPISPRDYNWPYYFREIQQFSTDTNFFNYSSLYFTQSSCLILSKRQLPQTLVLQKYNQWGTFTIIWPKKSAFAPKFTQMHGIKRGRYLQNYQAWKVGKRKVRDAWDLVESQGQCLQGQQIAEGTHRHLHQAVVIQPQMP